MKLSRFLFFLFLFLPSTTLNAQSFDWVRTMGGLVNTSNDLTDATVDKDENVYITGHAQGSYRPAAGEPLMYPTAPVVALIQKNDQDGDLVWAKFTEGTGLCYANSIAVDAQGYVYVAGSFRDTIDFDPNGGVAQEISSGPEWNGFLLKLESDGDFVWVRTFRNGFHEPIAIAVGPDQHIALTGYFGGTVDFNPGTGVTNITADGFSDIFLMKMNNNGNLMWARGFGSTDVSAYEQGRALTIDPMNNIYFTGYYSLFVDFDPNNEGSGELYHQHAYETDAFVAKFTRSGAYQWAHSPSSEQLGESIAVDDQGNCYVVCQDATYSTYIYSSSIYRFRTDGSDQRRIHESRGDGYERYFDIALAPNQQTFTVVGSFDDELDVGIQVLQGDWNSENGFIARFDTTGRDLWVRKLGRASLSGWWDNYPYSVLLPEGENIYLTGRFAQQTDFDPGSGTFNVTPSGDVHAYILKLSCIETSGQLDTATCFSFVSPSQHQTWDSSGVYQDTIANRYGCDSILTIHLTINEVDTAIKQTDSLLIALEDSASYQWVSCDSPSVVLDSGQSFAPPGSGQYALIVEKNGCSAMSACFAYTALGVTNLRAEEVFQLYPNPADDRMSLSWKGDASVIEQVVLRDALGRTVRIWQQLEPDRTLDVSAIPAGVYWFVLRSDDSEHVKKLIIH